MRPLQWLALSGAATALNGDNCDNSSCSPRPYSTWMADSIISRGQGIASANLDVSLFLQMGIVQTALLRLLGSPLPSSARCAEHDYRSYIQQGSESIIGRLLNASQDTLYPLDRLSTGRNLLVSYTENDGNKTVESALKALRESIDLQPTNQYGGLWYYIYPNWSYLDGMYSYVPFYSLYTKLLDPSATITTADDIIEQLDLLWNHCFDNGTGLLFHGYDASKIAVWANPVTGASPIVWDRALGWYFMALVDWLEINDNLSLSSQWAHLQARFVALANAIVKAADPVSGAWWQALNFPGREGNYIESSGSAMFVYGLYKGVRLGILKSPGQGTQIYKKTADKAYGYLVDTFVVDNQNGTLSWNGTVSVCSLNSSATYEYYVKQPLLFNSVLGSASFVLASLEHEIQVSK